MPSEGCLNGFLEAGGILCHHLLGLLKGVANGVITTRPGVVERCLVGAKVHVNVFIGQLFPEVYNVAYVGKRDGLFGGNGLFYAADKLCKVSVEFIHPALVKALLGGLGIDLCGDAHNARYVSGLGLGTGHSAKARRYEEFTGGAAALLAGSIHDCDCGAVHNALGAYVHVGTGGHLAILAHAHCVEFLPVIRL